MVPWSSNVLDLYNHISGAGQKKAQAAAKKAEPDDKTSLKDLTDVTRMAGVNLKVCFMFRKEWMDPPMDSFCINHVLCRRKVLPF